MALGDSPIGNAQSRSAYEAQNSKLRGEYFDTVVEHWRSQTDFLAQLQGGPGSGKPFVLKQELGKFAGDTINISVMDDLGQSGRRGDDRAVNYEETPAENSFAVKVDVLRVVLGYNQLSKWAAANKVSTIAAYPMLTGKRVGQIEQEDMIWKLRQRSNSQNTIRPGGKASLDTLRYSDTLDTNTFNIGYNVLTSNGADPASIGKMKGGMDLNKYICMGPNFGFQGIWQDPTFTNALQRCYLDGPMNPFWTNDLPDYNGCVLQRVNVINHSNPGQIGSAMIPEALLGDTVAGGTIASPIVIYGGGRTQSSLGDAKVLYKPFEGFYGNEKLFGKAITSGADAGTYYALIIDPADQKWTMFSYVGTDVGSNGNNITVTSRLHSSTTGTGVSTLGNVTYDVAVNKTGTFPSGSRIVQCNAYGVPVCDFYLYGTDAGAKAYGAWKNKQIDNEDDYKALQGIGTSSIYGCEMKIDTLGNYHRGFVRIQAAYEHALGVNLPRL
jgi:hypothetical protein